MVLEKRDIISQKTWDAFIFEHSPYALFQSWEWGEVEKKLGAKVWRWGWFNGNELISVAQIIKVLARRGTFLHVRHGPILSFGKEIYWKAINADIKELARSEGAWFMRVSPQIGDSISNHNFVKSLGFVSAPIHAMDAEVCWVLDINKPEEEILAGMRKTTRYEIRRAQKLGVTVHKTNDLSEFLTLYDRTSDRQGFVKHSGIREEVDTFGRDVVMLNAVFEGETIASAVVLLWGDEAIYHHGASIPSKVPASHLVQWEAILEAKKRGKKLYNFWGIAPDDSPNHPWRGLTVFKTGFGGREVRYIHALDNPVSRLYVIPKTIETFRKKLKGY